MEDVDVVDGEVVVSGAADAEVVVVELVDTEAGGRSASGTDTVLTADAELASTTKAPNTTALAE